MKILFISIITLFAVLLTYPRAKATFNISNKDLTTFHKKYGDKAQRRILIWDQLIESTKGKRTLVKLKIVNDFFNKLPYRLDKKHWGKKDYWATPFEFMGTGAGDCEDYAIAKYYTLRKLGVPEDKLRITYVKYLKKRSKYEQAHMVLTYQHKANSTPVVLDNINKKLRLASKRTDLKPIYSFNAQGLWKAKNKGKSSQRIGKNNLKSWKNLVSRI